MREQVAGEGEGGRWGRRWPVREEVAGEGGGGR